MDTAFSPLSLFSLSPSLFAEWPFHCMHNGAGACVGNAESQRGHEGSDNRTSILFDFDFAGNFATVRPQSMSVFNIQLYSNMKTNFRKFSILNPNPNLNLNLIPLHRQTGQA